MRPPSGTIRFLLLAMFSGVLVAGAPAKTSPEPPPDWVPLAAGLDLGTFAGPHRSSHGDSLVTVLRIDPKHWDLRLLNASARKDGTSRTVRDWITETPGAIAGINASMFHHGGASVSLMRTRDHVNSAMLTKDNAILAFDPLTPSDGLPPVRILDRTCENTTALMGSYGSLVQSIRMIDCEGDTTWAQQNKKWSTAAIGLDKEGRVLFVHARSPWTVHDFVDGLRKLPLGLVRLQYAEGGPEATLFVTLGGREIEKIGSYETGFNENDENAAPWPVPNVVAVVKKGSRTSR